VNSSGLVLVVDDDPDLRDLLTIALEQDGLDVQRAANGREAIDSMVRQRPDLILLDMKMPVMDGWAFCRELDRRGERPPIVVLTAASDPAERAAEVRAEGWLGKPFDYYALLAMVHRFVHAH
jgi:CheY-like chemotaxis protein